MMSGESEVRMPGRGLRVVYLAPKDILIPRVARKCMMHLCEALVELGADVELICLRVKTMASEPTRERSVWEVYGIERPFRVTMIPTPLHQRFLHGRIAQLLIVLYRLLVYPVCACRAYRRPLADGSKPSRTVFYTRNYGCAAGVLLLRLLLGERARLIIEVHVPPQSRLHRLLLRLVDGVACQSLALQQVLIQRGLVTSKNSVGRHGGCKPHGISLTQLSRAEAKRKLGWSPDDRVICYTGKVVWGLAEIDLILRAAAHIPPDGVRFVIVGGRRDHAQRWQEEANRRGLKNVSFVGFVAPSDVPLYQRAADVLVLYYGPDLLLNDYRSPTKLFEYMASGTPTVVADYLSIREVIRHEENGLLVSPGDPNALAAGITRLLAEPELASRLAAAAQKDSKIFTWEATARATLALIDKLWSNSA